MAAIVLVLGIIIVFVLLVGTVVVLAANQAGAALHESTQQAAVAYYVAPLQAEGHSEAYIAQMRVITALELEYKATTYNWVGVMVLVVILLFLPVVGWFFSIFCLVMMVREINKSSKKRLEINQQLQIERAKLPQW